MGLVEPHKEEGWYTDPFARHEERWMSNGQPTKLVRDQGKVSQDEPPNGPYVQFPDPVEHATSNGPLDLRRADDAGSAGPSGGSDPTMMTWDVVFSDGAPLNLLYLEEKSSGKGRGRRRHDRGDAGDAPDGSESGRK